MRCGGIDAAGAASGVRIGVLLLFDFWAVGRPGILAQGDVFADVRNPVPFVCVGEGKAKFSWGVRSLRAFFDFGSEDETRDFGPSLAHFPSAEETAGHEPDKESADENEQDADKNRKNAAGRMAGRGK